MDLELAELNRELIATSPRSSEIRDGKTFTVVQLPASVVEPELGRRKAQTRQPFSRHIA
jgi:hypothetical protein